MTKNDFLNSIEGYESETFEILANNKWVTGRINKIMEGSVQILCKENSKPRTIMYDDIRDIVNVDDISSSGSIPANNYVIESDIFALISKSKEKIIEIRLPLNDRRETIKRGMHAYGISAKWNPVNSSFMNAKKNHCVKDKGERLINILDDLYNECPIVEINLQIGEIFYELKEYNSAAIEFEKGFDYHNAALCAMMGANEEYALQLMAKTLLDKESATKEMLVNFFFYSAKVKHGAFCADVISKLDFKDTVYLDMLEECFYGLIYVVDAYGSTIKLPSNIQTPSEEHIQSLIIFLKNVTSNESFSPVSVTAKSILSQPFTQKAISQVKTGTITRYNRSNCCGEIDNNIFFHIRQVEDENLRQKLYSGQVEKIKVSYAFGSSPKGKVADHIIPIEDVNQLIVSDSVNVIHSGIIWDYTSHNGFGHIGEGDECYNFRETTIIDPFLIKYIDETIKISDLQVDFVSQKLNGKNYVVSMWLTECEENNEIVTKYEKQISQTEKSRFQTKLAEAKGEISVVYSCPDYVPLKAWKELPVTNNIDEETFKSSSKSSKIQPPPVKMSNPYQMGSKIMLTKFVTLNDLKHAWEYFKQAIEQNDQVGQSVNNLVNIAIRSGDMTQIDEAFVFLEQYQMVVGEEKYRNAKIQLLDKKKDFGGLCKFLENVIPKTYKANTKLHYIHKLALAYNKLGDYDNAIRCFNQWKKVHTSSKIQLGTTAFNPAMENNINRGIAIAYYMKGDKTEATSIAENLLKRNSDDAVAQQIISNTYSIGTVYKEESANSTFDYDYDDYEDNSYNSNIHEYVRSRMDSIQFSVQFAKKSISNHIKDNTYIGSAEEAAHDIDSYSGAINSMPSAARSDAWLALAKIVQQFIKQENFSDIEQKRHNLTQKRMNDFIGVSLSLSGDAVIQKQQQMNDTARYFYLMAMEILHKKNTYYVRSQELMISSFFLSENDLVTKISQTISTSPNSIQFPNVVNSHILSIKDFMLMSFLLPQENALPRKLMESVYNNQQLQNLAINELCRISSDVSNYINKIDIYGFITLWKNAKSEYERIIKELQDILKRVSSEKHMMQLPNCKEKIESILAKKVMFNTDERYIYYFLKIFDKCIRLHDVNTFDDSVDVYEGIMSDCENLLREIQEAPTKLSYEHLRSCCETMLYVSQENLNQLYKESFPNLKVTTNPVAYCFDGKIGRVTIIIENSGNVQSANISNIRVTGYQNSVIQHGSVISNVSSVKGNESREYVVDMEFSENEIERTTFDISVTFDYSFFALHNETVTANYCEIHSINIYGKEKFHAIEVNPFDRYKEGAAVDDDAMFKGRDRDIERITNMLKNANGEMMKHRGIYMFGQKRAGKSSIMAHLTKSIEEAYPEQYIIVDVGSIGKIPQNEQFEKSLKSKIIGSIRTTLRRKYRLIYDVLNANRDFFDEAIKQIENADGFTSSFDIAMDEISDVLDGKILMFLIDEYTYIYEGIESGLIRRDFPHFWKAFLQDNDVCSIVIGMDNMKKFVSLYQNDFASMQDYEVTYLDYEGACDLISSPIPDENGETRFDIEALEYIFTLTHGSAYLIMVLCAKLVDYMNETCTAHISRTTVETFIHKKWLADSMYDFEKLFDPQLNDPSIFGDQNINTANDNKIILTYIANQCNANSHIRISEIDCVDKLSTKTEEYLSQLIQQLHNRHVIDIEGDSCKIQVDLLRLYLKQKENLK